MKRNENIVENVLNTFLQPRWDLALAWECDLGSSIAC